MLPNIRKKRININYRWRNRIFQTGQRLLVETPAMLPGPVLQGFVHRPGYIFQCYGRHRETILQP